MTASIEVQFASGATVSANTLTITISNAEFALDSNNYLEFQGSFPFSDLSVATNAISISNPASGTAINGQINIPVVQGGGSGDPVIIVSNFQGGATAYWPTSTGRQDEPLAPGNQLTLSNFKFS